MASHDAYCLLTKDGELSTFQEVVICSNDSLLMTTMQEEMEALHRNKTWDLVILLEGQKDISSKWVYRLSVMVMIKWKDIMQDWWLKDMLKRKELISMK